MLNPVTVIAFDLDDTLWPCMPVIHKAENVLYNWISEHYPQINRDVSPDQMVEMRQAFLLDNPHLKVDLSQMRREFLKVLGDNAGYDGDRVSEVGFDVFFEARQDVDFYDDVFPVFERLQQKFQLGSISNGNACVKSTGLTEWFEHSVSAPDVKIAKPDPMIYQMLADRFEVEMASILYIGDDPHFDVVGPVKAGCQAIWINREERQWPAELTPPVFEISNLYELETILADHHD